jgi:SPP1 gp7 family putative phage head morphogenesis protein
MLFLKYAVDGLLKPNSRQKRAILAQIGRELDKVYNELATNEVETIADILKDCYIDIYIQYGPILNVNYAKPSHIDRVINTPIDGTLFSDRIWKNKDALLRRLNKAINDIMYGKTTIDMAGKQISRIFNVSAYESKRLLETEITRVQAQASKNIAEALDVRVMWSATFENTCEICAKLDSKIFDIDAAPAIPVHPHCRCILLPLVE